MAHPVNMTYKLCITHIYHKTTNIKEIVENSPLTLQVGIWDRSYLMLSPEYALFLFYP